MYCSSSRPRHGTFERRTIINTRPRAFARPTNKPTGQIVAASLLAASLALTACGGGTASGGGSGGDSSANTVNIGLIDRFGQGAAAESADDRFDGVTLGIKYVEEHGGLYNKAKINPVKGTENGQPALVATTVRKMLTDDVKLIIGPQLTADCLAAGSLMDQAGAVNLIGCTTTSLTGANRASKSLYRWETNDQLTSTALGVQVAKNFSDVQVVDVLAFDYLQGHEGVTTFMSALKAKGITPTKGHEFFVPSDTTNYSSQAGVLAQIPNDGKKRILVLLTWGSGYLNFLRQAIPLGLLDKYEAVVTTSMYYKSAVALAGTAPDIFNSYGVCHADLWKTEKMTWLKKEMLATNKRIPDDWSTAGFNSVIIMAAAINKAKSTDPAKVSEAMSTLEVDTAMGKMVMNPTTHQQMGDTPVCQTVGDKSAQETVKLVGGSLLPYSELIP